MALTLTSTIDADVTELHVTGSVGVEVVTGYLFRIGTNAEILMLRAFGPGPIPLAEGNPLRIGKDPGHWFVERGVDSSVPHTHTAGDTVFGVVDAYTSGDSEAEPSPFPSGGPGATPTLAEVLAQGNDTGGTAIVALDDTDVIRAEALVRGDGTVNLIIHDVDNTVLAILDMQGSGDLSLSGAASTALSFLDGDVHVATAGGGLGLTAEGVISDDGGNFAVDQANFRVTVNAGSLFIMGLPTSDPGVAGQVYNLSGVLMVSAGPP